MSIEKIAEILTVAKQPCLRDHIICKCSFRSYTFKPYLNLLLENGLLDAYPVLNSKHLSGRPTKRRMTYQTSQKGLEFLKRYNELLTLMEIPLKYAPKLNFCGSRHWQKEDDTKAKCLRNGTVSLMCLKLWLKSSVAGNVVENCRKAQWLENARIVATC